MPASLQSLPTELVERTVVLLDTNEVGFLRLTCRELRDKASQGSYLALFTHRSVDLTETGLKGLVNALNTSTLARQLRCLTLVGVWYSLSANEGIAPPKPPGKWAPPTQASAHARTCHNGPARHKKKPASVVTQDRRDWAQLRLLKAKHQYHAENGRYLEMLTDAFAAVKELAVGRGLESLKLGIMVQTWLDFRNTPDALRHTCAPEDISFLFATALDAVAASGLPIIHFDAFSDNRQCSLSLKELAAYLTRSSPSVSLAAFGSQLQSLAISFTAPFEGLMSSCCECNERRYRRQGAAPPTCHIHGFDFTDAETSCTYSHSLAALLALCPNLQNLHLHCYERSKPDSDEDPDTSTFTHLASKLTLRNLQTCTLRGLALPESALLTFLRRHIHLRSLTLDNLNLTRPGRWSRILTHIQTHQTNLTHLSLTSLYEAAHRDPLPNNNNATTNNTAFFPGIPPPPLDRTDTLLNSLLGWRVLNDPPPAHGIALSGRFGNNSLLLTGAWVQRAEVRYAAIGYANVKAKVEMVWEEERMREFGPPLV